MTASCVAQSASVLAALLWMILPARGASLLSDALELLDSWDMPSGFVSVQDGSFAPASSGVTYRMLISSGAMDDPDAPSVPEVDNYVGASVDVGGHATIDAGGAVEGSAIKRTFHAAAGDVLAISFDFLTAEGSAILSTLSPEDQAVLHPVYIDDYAFVALTHGGFTQVMRLADILTPGYQDAEGLTDERFVYQTGFRTFQLTLPQSGNLSDDSYTIALGVMDGGANYLDGDLEFRAHQGESALLLEKMDVGPPGSIPEPGGYFMVVIAVWMTGLMRHRAA